MSMHAKTDSEVTSLTASSPTRSPRRPYYVQSPSRDSHDGEKTTNSFHSTPVLSPMGSPGHHSRDSSSTRYSGSRKVSGRHHQHHRKGDKDFGAIEEEGFLDDDENHSKGFPRRCYFPAFVVGFFVLFSFFSLILYAASKPQKPVITMKSISYDQFKIQAGTSSSGVATDMVTMNSTVKLTFRNTGTFFGVHVTSSSIDIAYSDLTLATGTIKKFYQSRKSQRSIAVTLKGGYVPLYGASVDWSSKDGKLTAPVPLSLNFTVRARGYVLGKLVKPKFYKTIQCNLNLDPKKMNKPISLKNSCTYK